MKQILFATLVSLLLFCACGKESNTTATPVIPVNDSIYLAKVVALDTTKTAPLDTVYINYYSFDNSHRLISNKFVEYDGSESTLMTYFYNGTDSLPFKAVETDFIPVPDEITTRFFKYQPGTNKVILDSIIMVDGDTLVISSIYSGDSFASYSDFYTASGQNHNGPYYTTITKQNGNITSQVDTVSFTRNEYACTYDNHPNPFYNVAFYSQNSIPSIYKTAPDCFGLNNNVTSININSRTLVGTPSTRISAYTYTWKYRNDGYPLEVIMRDNGSTDPHELNKLLFYYTN